MFKSPLNSSAFDFLFSGNIIDSSDINNAISELCRPSNTIEDLFQFRFCTALELGLISLVNYQIDSNSNSLASANIDTHNKFVDCYNFVVYDHSLHLALQTTLTKFNLLDLYKNYCEYLQRLVIHVILHYEQIKNTKTFEQLSSDFQDKLRTLKLQFPLDLNYSYMLDTSSTEETHLLKYLQYSLLKHTFTYQQFTVVLNTLNQSVLDLCLALSTTLNVKNTDGDTIFTYAAQCGLHTSLEKLLKHTCEHNLKSDQTLNLRDVIGHNALSTAVIIGNVDCVKLLIEYGVDVDEKDTIGNTPLIMAAKYKFTECILLLLELGHAQVDCMNSWGKTSLMSAAQEGLEKGIIYMLIHGANPILSNNLGFTAFMYCVYNGYTACVSALLPYSDINFQTKSQKKTALTQIQTDNVLDCLCLILDHNVNLELENSQQQTILTHFAQYGNDQYLIKLIEAGANLNAIDMDGNSALIHAVIAKHKNCVSLLLNYGADTSIVNNKGETALSYASKLQNKEILQMIESNSQI